MKIYRPKKPFSLLFSCLKQTKEPNGFSLFFYRKEQSNFSSFSFFCSKESQHLVWEMNNLFVVESWRVGKKSQLASRVPFLSWKRAKVDGWLRLVTSWARGLQVLEWGKEIKQVGHASGSSFLMPYGVLLCNLVTN